MYRRRDSHSGFRMEPENLTRDVKGKDTSRKHKVERAAIRTSSLTFSDTASGAAGL